MANYLLNKRVSLVLLILLLNINYAFSQGIKYNGNLSPSEGLIKTQEKPYRDEICINGKWDFQPIAVPESWKKGKGVPPELPLPENNKWESIKIKIPSPWNVNTWGAGSKVGKGTRLPFSPGSIYYPSYPESWENVKMAWLKKTFNLPLTWSGKEIIIHFEAIAGDAVVLINGHEAGKNFDNYLPFEIDISSLVKNGVENTIMVGIRDRKLFDISNEKYEYMQATYPPGSTTDNLIGIWQDVFIEALPPIRISNIFAKPDVDKDKLEFEVELINHSSKKQLLNINGQIKEWVNQAKTDNIASAEIKWDLGKSAITLDRQAVLVEAGATKKITLSTTVDKRLKYWSPKEPNLYTAIFDITVNGKKNDIKTERFGWRSFTIKGKDFYLNKEKIQCFGDLQHPFGPYICSRRFAWAWYKMIKDVGGNSVRPHAQPWPRVYYDLADEMGLMVLDETALFGSSIRLNFEENITWKRAGDQVDKLILRDRNHPSVIGWSIGNELFAIALLNKPKADVSKKWDERIIELGKRPRLIDPTRQFVTSDGDRDMDGSLPVWSKHFGHGLNLNQLPDIDKPLVVGESGATYYGKPKELYPFVGLKAYGTYYNRNEALAIDLYQNVVKMAKPLLSWFSPSEICWFGIEHLNLGYHDYTRLPNIKDGIFPGQDYKEGQPGYQFERIPPYVTTFNPGLDPKLPLYKPLPMFNAMKDALANDQSKPSKWDHNQDTTSALPKLPQPLYKEVYLIGDPAGNVARLLDSIGIKYSTKKKSPFTIIDASTVSRSTKEKNIGEMISSEDDKKTTWIIARDSIGLSNASSILSLGINCQPFSSTALSEYKQSEVGKYFNARTLYFSEMEGDNAIVKYTFSIKNPASIEPIFKPAFTDWALFNGVDENRKCAQIVLYEHLDKVGGLSMVKLKQGKSAFILSSIDYTIINSQSLSFWRKLAGSMRIDYKPAEVKNKAEHRKKHDLLLDGPTSN
ncbi:glycoside hydrolase family 2 protein [Pedobacter sp. JCM 36344]|uniref:glycoside hydrolase family 2 protein n=1 Tax=Pedobacter sp. JCM 36344 TaxID=3374280 RepID=UPI00397CFAA0